jgi:transcriptional regulator with XRE-family HTH domain
MIEYKDRLIEAMKLSEMTVAGLAKALGMSYQGVKKVVNGKSASFGLTNNQRAAQALGVNADWLAGGQGRMSAREHPIDVEGNPTSAISPPVSTPLTSAQTIDRLGQLLSKADEKTRNAAAAMLLQYAQDPADGKRLADAIAVLLADSNNDPGV